MRWSVPGIIAGDWVLGDVTLVSDALHQLPQTLVVCGQLIVPGSQNQRPRGPRHTQCFENKPADNWDGEVKPDCERLRLHPTRFEAGESFVNRLSASPPEV